MASGALVLEVERDRRGADEAVVVAKGGAEHDCLIP